MALKAAGHVQCDLPMPSLGVPCAYRAAVFPVPITPLFTR